MSVKDLLEKEWRTFYERDILYPMPDYKNVAGHEPAPNVNNGPCIQDLAIDDALNQGYRELAAALELRKLAGVEKYKTVLQPNNGRNAMMDLYQELLDAIVYARQALYEEARKPPVVYSSGFTAWPPRLVQLNEIYRKTLELAEMVRPKV